MHLTYIENMKAFSRYAFVSLWEKFWIKFFYALNNYKKQFTNAYCLPLCEMSVSGVYLVRVFFLYSDWIGRFTEQIIVFSSNMEKYEPEKSEYRHILRSVLKENILNRYHLGFSAFHLKRDICYRKSMKESHAV